VSTEALARMSTVAVQGGSFLPNRWLCSDPTTQHQYIPLHSFRQCKNLAACVGGPGGDVCVANTTVPFSRLCDVCKEGFVKVGQDCRSCAETSGGAVVAMVLALLFLIGKKCMPHVCGTETRSNVLISLAVTLFSLDVFSLFLFLSVLS